MQKKWSAVPCRPLVWGIVFLFVILTVFQSSVLWAEELGRETADVPMLKNLTPNHPRVFMNEEQCRETAALLKTDADLQKIYAKVEKEAEKYLKNEETVEYVLIGPRLLTQSRRCLRKILALGTVYRLGDDAAKKEACLKRAMMEIHAAAAFPDWNPSHFLDTAEMTAAFAIAYDWFFSDLSQADKDLIANSIYEKGLIPSTKKRWWWKKSAYNWNQVCHGGLAMGAAAIADADVMQDPEKQKLIEESLQNGVRAVGIAMKSFAPDGAWGEGPGYWCYTTLYTLFYIEAMESSFGTDFGISDFAGFDKTGDSLMALASPTGSAFNFADGGAGNLAHSQMMWLANRFGHPEWTQFYLNFYGKVYPTAVWYYRPAKADLEQVPFDFMFREAEIATFRSSWTDRNAWFLGFKAGGNAVNHSHLELGSFVLDHDAVRWAVDLGADNYNLPGYFKNLRWTYYRLATRGQNTLCVDDQNQDPKAVALLKDFSTSKEKGSVTADLTEAYAAQLKFARRSVCLDRAKSEVSISDEIGPGTESTIGKPLVWHFHTRAAIEVAEDGKSAVLTQKAGKDEKKLCVTLEEATYKDARFEVRKTTQSEAENPNEGILRLVVEVPVTEEKQVLRVRFSAP